MLREYATCHALASQKGQRETVAPIPALPIKQERDSDQTTTTPTAKRVGGEARATPETISRRKQMCDLFRVSPDGAPQTGALDVRHHLPTAGIP